jgi:aconitase B
MTARDPLPTAEKDAPRRAWPVGGVAGEVAQFNDLVSVGTPVLYWPGARVGPGRMSATRTRAWLLGDHTPVVMVEGFGGGVALTHVCPIPPGGGRTDGGAS